jgi:outer membrane phospholipase A
MRWSRLLVALAFVVMVSGVARAQTSPDGGVDGAKSDANAGVPEPELLQKYDSDYFMFGGVGKPDNQAKFQLSIRYGLFTLPKIFFLKHVTANLGYTQTSWWDLYEDSQPFLESNYMPEFFFEWRRSPCLQPIETNFVSPEITKAAQDWRAKKASHRQTCDENSETFTTMSLGYIHQSNGNSGGQSRGWDRAYVQGTWRARFGQGVFDDRAFFEITPRAWWIIDSELGSHDVSGAMPPMSAPNTEKISKYYGFGEVRLTVASPMSTLGQRIELETILRRGMPDPRNGGLQTSLRFRFLPKSCFSPWILIQWWYGQGQRLLRYNEIDNELRFGFVLQD